MMDLAKTRRKIYIALGGPILVDNIMDATDALSAEIERLRDELKTERARKPDCGHPSVKIVNYPEHSDDWHQRCEVCGEMFN